MTTMQYGRLPGLEKPVSRLVTGTMALCRDDDAANMALLDGVFEQGGNAFDTAYIYGGGRAESALGSWMEARGVRDRVVVLGKGGHGPGGTGVVDRATVRSELAESLERLRTDHVDIYMLHRDAPDTPVGEIVDVLDELVDDGLARVFGGSNWTHQRVRAANEYAAARGRRAFAASSPNLCLAEAYEPLWAHCVSVGGPGGAEARAWYAAAGVALLPWSSIGRGFFSGRLTPQNYAHADEILEECACRAFCREPNRRRLERAFELAGERGLSVPQVALAWVLGQPLEVFPLVGSATPAEFAQNVEALDVELTPAELDWLALESDAR